MNLVLDGEEASLVAGVLIKWRILDKTLTPKELGLAEKILHKLLVEDHRELDQIIEREGLKYDVRSIRKQIGDAMR